jgi:hypothetical protein
MVTFLELGLIVVNVMTLPSANLTNGSLTLIAAEVASKMIPCQSGCAPDPPISLSSNVFKADPVAVNFLNAIISFLLVVVPLLPVAFFLKPVPR